MAVFGLCMLAGKWGVRILLSLFLMLHFIITFIFFFITTKFHIDFSADTLFVLSVSSPDETREFIHAFVDLPVILSVIAGIALTVFLITRLWKARCQYTLPYLITAVLLLLPFSINATRFCIKGDYEDIYGTADIPVLISSYMESRESMQKMINMVEAPVLPQDIRRKRPDLSVKGVLVIGESASRTHMGIYGYPRNTTPEMEVRKKNLLIFDNMLASYPTTIKSLCFLLTTATLKNEEDLRYSIYDILNKAGYHTPLISRQASWGKFDGPISFFTAHAAKRIYLHKIDADALDDACEPFFVKELETESPLFVTIHLMGSHRQFDKRYPKEFAVFDQTRDHLNAELNGEDFSDFNTYDNSIAYTDYVLGKLINDLSNSKGPAFLIYLSDHGESVTPGERRSSASIYPPVYEVPLIFWCNQAYREAFPDIIANGAANLHKPMQMDTFTHAILSAADITFSGFPEKDDVFSDKYEQPAFRIMSEKKIPCAQ